MRSIDMQTWSRRAHFSFFNAFEHPRFNITANMDITELYPAVKHRQISFTVAIVYLLSRSANAIPEFRQRIRGEKVVEHERVHPNFTILVDDEIFSFCGVDYDEDFRDFEKSALLEIERVKKQLTLEDDPERDDWLFMTAIPWVSFSALQHPMMTHPGDCIPRLAWGKFFRDGERLKMPLSVDAHHALVDGLHVGKFYAEVEGLLREPEGWLSR